MSEHQETVNVDDDNIISPPVAPSSTSSSSGPSPSRKRHLSECILKYSSFFETGSVEFNTDDSFQITCKECKKKIKGTNRSASNLRTHYKNVHGNMFPDLVKEIDQSKKPAKKPKTATTSS